MSVHMVEAKIRRESVTDVQAAAEKMFAAINAAQPEGIRYASSLLPDGETFVALLQVDDGVKNPLLGFPPNSASSWKVWRPRVPSWPTFNR